VKILESVLYGEDLHAAHAFYCGFLGLEEILFDPERSLFLRCEGSVLILFKASKTRIPDAGVPPHGTEGTGHLAFHASHEEMGPWRERLSQANIPIIDEVCWKNGAHSIYFNDPAGNVLEFATPDLWGLDG
jgi:catechol 2,3-dioxygenase-like lactoylglutathione lyase family enzyme